MSQADRTCDACGSYVPWREGRKLGKLWICGECAEKPEPRAEAAVSHAVEANTTALEPRSHRRGYLGIGQPEIGARRPQDNGYSVPSDHVQRIKAGIERARASGIQIGRPPMPMHPNKLRLMFALHAQGVGTKRVAARLGVSRRKVQRELQKVNIERQSP